MSENVKLSVKGYKITISILIIAILAVIIFLVGRNITILKDISQKAEKTSASENYYAKVYMYQGEEGIKIESYYKDNKEKTTITTQMEDETENIEYNNGKNITIYKKVKEEKLAFTNINAMFSKFTELKTYKNYVTTSLKNYVFADIKTVTCNGRECYFISNIETMNELEGYIGVFIDKETGLPIRILQGEISSKEGAINGIMDFKYSFNTVEDKDMIEPNIKEYKIQQ